jgi:hypothetical protein
MSSNIKQICFETIDDEYSYGMYGDFKVIMHTKTSYINITKMCKEYSNKEYKNWLQNDKSIELIKYVDEHELKHSKLKATFSKKAGGTNETLALISGTYAHPLIVPQVAQWISPKFAIMVSKIINNHLVDEYLLKLDEKDGEIDSLNSTIKRLEKKMDKMNSMLDDQGYKLDEANDNIEFLTDELVKKDKNINIKDKVIDIATNQRVPSTKSITKTENFIVMKSKDKDNNNNGYRYRIIAGLRNYANNACEKLLENDFKEILRLEDVNNSKNVLHRLKEKYKKNNIVDFSGSRFSIVDKTKINQSDFIIIIKELFQERKNVDASSESDNE